MSQHHIYILSYGIDPYRDISLRTLEILQQCSEVYVVRSNLHLASFLQTNKINYKDITHIYLEGKRRIEVYETIAQFLIQRAAPNKTIAYLTYGDPMLFELPTQLILVAAKELGLSVKVIPALSFIDTILASLEISIGTEGLAVYEATSLVKKEIKIDNRVHCLVAQVGAFNSIEVSRSVSISSTNLSLLVDYLRCFYPPHHLLRLCHGDEGDQEIASVETPLCLMTMFSEGINYTTTLYIPPLREINN